LKSLLDKVRLVAHDLCVLILGFVSEPMKVQITFAFYMASL